VKTSLPGVALKTKQLIHRKVLKLIPQISNVNAHW